MSQLKIKNGNTWEVVGTDGVGVPSGGTTNQVLKKINNSDYATAWSTISATDIGALPSDITYVSTVNGSSGAVTINGVLPSGGLLGEVLQKNSATSYDTRWTAIDTLPVDCLFGGTAIPSNSNLNDTTYLVPGNYTSLNNANTSTLSNTPEGLTEAFMLRVYAPLDTNIQNASVVTGTWKYRFQEIHSMYGNKIWRRFCHIDSTADTWTIENWRLITVQDGIYVVSTAPSSASPDGLYFVVSS